MTPIEDDSKIFETPSGLALLPIPPGETVAAELRARGLSAHRAALKMRISPGRLGQIVAERDHGAEIAAQVEAA